jgi:DNA modification methylase
MGPADVFFGNCLDVMKALPDASVDSIVCDPPYGLGFMGKAWDALPPGVEWAAECLRVLKPGGHLVAFGGTRTVHRLATAIEDAGFEIRDAISWCYWSGFPKSLDVSKAIDKAAGAEREVVGTRITGATHRDTRTECSATAFGMGPVVQVTAPATPEAARWAGFGTAIKPAVEPAVLARRPLVGTVAANVLEHGTGALNIDGCRFAPGAKEWPGPCSGSAALAAKHASTTGLDAGAGRSVYGTRTGVAHEAGRFPANLLYVPKASRKERERGTEGLPTRTGAEAVGRAEGSPGSLSPGAGAGRKAREIRNFHPTVKPVRLMRWLCRLVTPPGGLVLDPFAGSGSCGVAAVLEGFAYAGIEIDPAYHAIAEARIRHALSTPDAWADTAPGTEAPECDP